MTVVNCNECGEPITTDGAIRSGAAFHRKCLPKRPWVRPDGCECDASEPRNFKCTKSWMRCGARIDYVLKQKPSGARRSGASPK